MTASRSASASSSSLGPLAPVAFVVGVLAAACGGPGGHHPTAGGLALTEAGIAAITVATPVDAATLGRLVPDAEVRPDKDTPGVLELWRGDERLFYVVAASLRDPAVGPFNVHVTSPAIAGPHGWRVGATLARLDGLDTCECWSDLRVCYQTGSHVAVAIDHDDCADLPATGAIVGKPIARLVWNPLAWPASRDTVGGESVFAPDDGDGDEYDGEDGGEDDGEDGGGE